MNEPYYTLDTLKPEKSISFLVKRCAALMTRVVERRFGTEPLSFTEWFVLASLSRYEHVTPTTLSEETSYNMGALCRIVDGLERSGLVRRERSKHDRRAVEIALTSEGGRRLQGGKRVLVNVLNELAAPYSRRELRSLIELLQRMLLRLQASESHEEGRAQSASEVPRRRALRRSTSARAT